MIGVLLAAPAVVSWVVVMVLEARSQRQAAWRVRRRKSRSLVVWHDVVFGVPHVMNIGVWSD